MGRLLRGDRDRALPLGLASGLSLPACATPLVLAALAGGVSASGLPQAFLSLFLFGAALSLPLAALVLHRPATETLTRFAARMRRLPGLTGALIAVLGIFMVLFEQ